MYIYVCVIYVCGHMYMWVCICMWIGITSNVDRSQEMWIDCAIQSSASQQQQQQGISTISG